MAGTRSNIARTLSNFLPGRLLGATLVCTAVALAPSVQARSTESAQPEAASLALPGLPVDSIHGIEEITGIKVLDTFRLSFRVNRSARYLVQFAPACTQLPYARNIAMSSTTGTLQAGFDTVAADGQQCRINRIYRL